MAQDKPGKNGDAPEWERGAPPPQPFRIWKGDLYREVDQPRGPGPTAPDPTTVFPSSDRWQKNNPDVQKNNPFWPPNPDIVKDKGR